MALTVTWAEYNDGSSYASPSKANVTNIHWVSVDEADADPLANPITNGTNSYEKMHAVIFNGFAGESVNNFKLWAEYLDGAGNLTDKRYQANGDKLVFKDLGKVPQTPSTTATPAASDVPASQPVSSNLGGGPVTVNGDGTDIFITQVQIATASRHHGGGATLYVSYDETS